MLWAVCRPSGGKAPVMIELWMKSGFYLILIYHIFTSFHVYTTMIFGSRRVTLPLVLRAVFCPACVGSLPCRNLSCRPWIWASMAVSQVTPTLWKAVFTPKEPRWTKNHQEVSWTDYLIIPCFQGLDEGRGARGTRRVFGASNVSTGAASNLCLMVAVWLRLFPFYQAGGFSSVFLLVFLVPDNDGWRYESRFCVQILCLQFHPTTWSLRRSLTWRCWFYALIRITNSGFSSSPINPGVLWSLQIARTATYATCWVVVGSWSFGWKCFLECTGFIICACHDICQPNDHYVYFIKRLPGLPCNWCNSMKRAIQSLRDSRMKACSLAVLIWMSGQAVMGQKKWHTICMLAWLQTVLWD